MSEPIVVANSSPFIALERIGQLHLLPALVPSLWIPPAVRQEVFGAKPLPEWVKEVPVQQPLGPQMVSTRLGAGEREAIALALEMEATELIIDDLSARRLAISLSLPVIGTLGILLRAKRLGLISIVRPLLEALQDHGFHISGRVLDGILVAAGEGSDENS
jgi:predicted nucleic acid-binding protein